MQILTNDILENGVHKWSGTANEKEWTLFCGDAVALCLEFCVQPLNDLVGVGLRHSQFCRNFIHSHE